MLTLEEAKEIGFNACVDKIGREFVLKNKDFSVVAYGEDYEKVYVFFGVSDTDYDGYEGAIVLDSTSKWPYQAECYVFFDTGNIEFGECIIPNV